MLRWATVAVVRGHDAAPPPPPAAGLHDVAERAEYHRITPLVHAVADRIGDLEPTVRASLAASYHHAVRRHLFVLDDLRWVGAVLAELDPTVLVIKGPVLSGAVYARPDLRTYGDLDVVVPARSFARAVELLTAAGAAFCEPDWQLAVSRRHGEVALGLPSGTVVDLHWHVVPIGAMRDRFTVPMGPIIERARTVVLDGHPCRTLDPSDTVVHLALHAALCGGDRLGWLVDLHAALDPAVGDPPALDAVVATARGWGVEMALASQLDRVQRLLGPVPGVDDALGSPMARRTRRATELADRLQPPERSTGARTIGVALGWATAPTAAGSAVQLARMGIRWATGRSDDHEAHAGELERPRQPSAAAWRDYLATVEPG